MALLAKIIREGEDSYNLSKAKDISRMRSERRLEISLSAVLGEEMTA